MLRVAKIRDARDNARGEKEKERKKRASRISQLSLVGERAFSEIIASRGGVCQNDWS